MTPGAGYSREDEVPPSSRDRSPHTRGSTNPQGPIPPAYTPLESLLFSLSCSETPLHDNREQPTRTRLHRNPYARSEKQGQMRFPAYFEQARGTARPARVLDRRA